LAEAESKVAELEKKLEAEKTHYSTLKAEYDKKMADIIHKSSDEVANWRSKAETSERQLNDANSQITQLTSGLIWL